MKTLYLIPVLLLLAACDKREDIPTQGFQPPAPPFACDHVVTNFDGALALTSRQDIPTNVNPTLFPHDGLEVYLCKAGTQCDTLAGVNWSRTGGTVTILDGDQIHTAQGFDTYSIVATQCR